MNRDWLRVITYHDMTRSKITDDTDNFDEMPLFWIVGNLHRGFREAMMTSRDMTFGMFLMFFSLRKA